MSASRRVTVSNIAESFGIVKDDAERMPVAGTHATHPMAQVDTIGSSGALHGSMVNREDDAIALVERHHLGARLHPWPLFRKHEFAAGEALSRLR